ncbi:endolytic transglycosylase MltG [Streptomyces rimosus]|uniref:endolytic transglycosylase MltG n=1 Tax=Streptomyces rimosus TaxID=1927 RepID=UPI00067C435D|nr:endolytic transglycosylase MltG [Streptomyces rimosus]
MSDVLHTGHGPRSRLTRRGRLLLAVGLCAVLALIAVVVTRLLGGPGHPPLTIPEGRRATQVYAAVDKALGVAPGTTEKAAKSARLKLPEAAKGNPEGFLYPATYPVDGDTTPASLLSFMTNTAAEKQAADGIRAYETVIIASIVQAEADRTADMGKVARVIENRLERGMPLQMDSTINYALGRSSLNTSHADTRLNSPYNTYRHKGLPPTPIDNPGQDALRAAAQPPAGDWLYFVTVAPGDTRFTADYAQHRANVREFNERHGR